MSDPYLGEIRLFGGNYAPDNWALCNGQLLAIADYNALYALIGTTYGGNGTTNFAVPNLQNALAVGQGQAPGGMQNYPFGTGGGQYEVALTSANMPSHTHAMQASTTQGSSLEPMNSLFAATSDTYVSYLDSSKDGETVRALWPNMLSSQGGNQAHNNMMPTIGVSYIICTLGIYPTSN